MRQKFWFNVAAGFMLMIVFQMFVMNFVQMANDFVFECGDVCNPNFWQHFRWISGIKLGTAWVLMLCFRWLMGARLSWAGLATMSAVNVLNVIAIPIYNPWYEYFSPLLGDGPVEIELGALLLSCLIDSLIFGVMAFGSDRLFRLLPAKAEKNRNFPAVAKIAVTAFLWPFFYFNFYYLYWVTISSRNYSQYNRWLGHNLLPFSGELFLLTAHAMEFLICIIPGLTIVYFLRQVAVGYFKTKWLALCACDIALLWYPYVKFQIPQYVDFSTSLLNNFAFRAEFGDCIARMAALYLLLYWVESKGRKAEASSENYSRQNVGVNSTNTVNTSSRPMSIATVQTQV